MRIQNTLSVLLLTPALAAHVALEGVALQHAPEAGTTLTRTFTQRLELELQDQSMTFLLNGEEHPAESPEVEVTLVDEESTKVVDTITASEDGRVSKVSRKFESLLHTSEQDVQGPDIEGGAEPEERTSALEGKTVVLTRDGDEWAAAWAEDEEGDAELLEGHNGDGGYGWMLPGREVEVGDSWELDAAAFLAISEPLGDLHFVDDEGEGGDDEFEDLFAENLEVDSFVATLESLEDGVATITFELEATTSVEQEQELPPEVEGSATQTYAFEFELEGKCTWQVEAKHLGSFEMRGDVTMNITAEQEMSQEGFEMELTNVQEFSGTLEIAASVE